MYPFYFPLAIIRDQHGNTVGTLPFQEEISRPNPRLASPSPSFFFVHSLFLHFPTLQHTCKLFRRERERGRERRSALRIGARQPAMPIKLMEGADSASVYLKREMQALRVDKTNQVLFRGPCRCVTRHFLASWIVQATAVVF